MLTTKPTTVMRHQLLATLVLFCSLLSFHSQAQTDISIGTGTTGNQIATYPSPLQDFNEGSRAQYLYTGAELTAAGMVPGTISTLKFNVTDLNLFFGTIEEFTIRMGATSATSLSASTWETVSATNLYGPINYVPTAGINAFTLSTPFVWDGVSNIVVEICNGDANNANFQTFSNNVSVPWTTGLAFNGSHTTVANNLGNLCGTTTTTNTGTQTTRPNIIFTNTAAASCSGALVGGTAVSTATTVCLNSIFTLSVSGTPIASGITYQWQYLVGSTWTNISGATGVGYTTSQAATTTYRRTATCTNGGASAISTPVTVTTPAQVAGTFTINSAAPTGGTNFQTFNAAYNYIKCGINGPVVFNVNATSGPYNEQLILQPVPGASSANTVTFLGNGRTIKYSSTNTSDRAVIKLDDADHIRLDSLTIDATPVGTATTYGYGVQFINNADSNVVRGCTIIATPNNASTNYAGIVMNASATSAITNGATLCDSNYIAQNVITGGYYGITTVGSPTDAVQRNVVRSNIVRDFYNTGIYTSNTFSELIEANDISRPNATTVGLFWGIYSTGISVLMQVSKNRVHNPFDGALSSTFGFYGIIFSFADAVSGFENRVFDNLIYNANGAGGIYGLYNSSSDYVLYQHNTVSLDQAGSIPNIINCGFYQTLQATGIQLANNIISIQKNGNGRRYAVYLDNTATTYTANNNDYFVNTAGNNGFIGFNGANQLLLTNWQAATGQDAASRSADPLYTSTATGNYRPMAVVIDNIGQNLGVTTDIENVPRSATTPDPGAYEFTIPACSGTVSAGTATSSVDTVCANTIFVLSTSGSTNSSGITYQWQSSPDGITWANINGATLQTLNTSQVATTFYRLIINCTASATTATSSVKRVFTPGLVSGTFTINNLAPGGSGNFQSFNTAYDYIKCGINGPVVFNVNAVSGPYTEQLIIAEVPGASATNTVTFNGNGRTLKFASANTDERAVVKFNGADHFRIDSLVIDASGGTYGYGVQFINNADSNTVTRCAISSTLNTTSTNFAGIVVGSSNTVVTLAGASLCDSNYVAQNRISGGYYGVVMVGGATQFLQRNVLQSNIITDFYFYGIYTSYVANMPIEGNDISRPTATNVSFFYGVFTIGGGTGLTISKNRIHNPFDGLPNNASNFYGIFFSNVDADNGNENKITNNIIYNINGQGTQYGINNTGSDNAQYYHNTISLDNTASTAVAGFVTEGFYQINQASGIVFVNNIISITRGGLSTKHAIYMGTPATTYTANRNDYYVNAAAGTNYIGYNGTNQGTLAAWQAATGQDAATLSQNPQFTAAAAGNLKPLNIVIDNRGTPVGITTDILNGPRSTTTPDIGAFEFSIPSCTTPPVAGTATANPMLNICMGTPVDLRLTGATIGTGLTVQWQYAATTAGPWNNLGSPLPFADTTIFATTTLYYRALVTCSGNTTTSTPVLVTIKSALLSGFYTINPALPVSATNFQTFASAVFAMECGITGFVTFDVSPGTYNEQIRMRSINGAGPNSRVTFRSLTGIPSSVTLSSNAATVAANYVLQLDSASYITYRDMSITSTNSTSARVVNLSNTASYDSLVNCNITTAVSTNTTTPPTSAGVFANTLVGTSNVIKGNTIVNGGSGIYLTGVSAALSAKRTIVDSNTVNGTYYYGIYVGNTNRVQVSRNNVTTTAPLNTTAYGIYGSNCDSACQFVGNNISISNTTGTVYGLYTNNSTNTQGERGRIANNSVQAITGNNGALYGLFVGSGANTNVVNNVINVRTTSTTAFGLYSTNGSGNNYWNNTVQNASTATGFNNAAGYFDHISGFYGNVNIQNNIFSHTGGGLALSFTTVGYAYSDYNMLYTTGNTLLVTSYGAFNNLSAWQTGTGYDKSSIVYAPAFVSASNLSPNIADSTVWGMHGRGTQIADNNYDFYNNPRPTTLQAGVPDLGAYEFLPTSLPVPLTAIPAAPIAGGVQTFMLGTDTVTKITWATGGPVPPSIIMRRYSGILPPGVAATSPRMYFYVDADTMPVANYNATVRQFYIDSWQGFINSQTAIKMGKTLQNGTWVVNQQSVVNELDNYITETGINYLDKFTGLVDGQLPYVPQVINTNDSSNKGTQFWVGYGHNDFFNSNNRQDMVLYLSADQAATVTVRVNGTPYSKTYTIPANSSVVATPIPKTGTQDARLLAEGLTNRGISITSDVPIAAYAHITATSSSGSTMLLPVGLYGYDYSSLNTVQSGAESGPNYSWVNVIAAYDSTLVQITPAKPTLGGRAAGVPFTVLMNKGDVYQVLGAIENIGNGYDMSGTRVLSVANAFGKCYPVAVFSGSSRTGFGCNGARNGNADGYIQQNFPSQAFGRRYLTAPTSVDVLASTFMTNIYRVAVKDPTTVVTRNGVPLTGLVNNYYYQFESGTADYIQADKPITVAQMETSSLTNCANTNGNGDPEIFYLSSIEQGAKKATFYRTTSSNIAQQYVTLIIPTAGVASLRIDGSNTFDHTYAHPNLAGYTVVVKRWGTAANATVTIVSDSAFTAITYGLGPIESYGFNIGMTLKTQNASSILNNTQNNTGIANQYTCAKTPFRVSILLPLQPTQLLWNFNALTNITPNINVTQLNPVPADSTLINGVRYYRYTVNQDYTIADSGTYTIPVTYTSPSIEGCSNSLTYLLQIVVRTAVKADFTATPLTTCVGQPIQLNGAGTSGAYTINRWNWSFPDATTSTLQNPSKAFATAGTKTIALQAVTVEGCVGDTTKTVTVNPLPTVALVRDTLTICPGQADTLRIASPVTGITYRWYTVATGGTSVFTGTTFPVTATGSYYAEATSAAGCVSTRAQGIVTVYTALATPTVTVDSAGVNFVRFRWNAVAGALSYSVSTDGGITFTTPSSGTTGLTHTVSPLAPATTASLIVRANGAVVCQNSVSAAVPGRTLPDQIYIPNVFTPNGDGRNDVWLVYSYIIRNMRMAIFNQWGQKIFESTSQQQGWDGTFKGQQQPVGVYVYIVKMTLNDGSQVEKKGSVNLVR